MSFENGEQIVSGMLAKAEHVVADVMREFHISHILAAFSGGNDSIVATHWAMTRFPDCVAMTADTGIGLQATRNHQANVCEMFRWDREIAQPRVEGPPKGWDGDWIDGETSYEEFCLNHGFPGPGQHHRMYQRLKQRAFRIVKGRLGKRPMRSRILVVSGIRGDESAVRAGYMRAFKEEPSECFVWMNPFYYCTASDFAVYRDEFGLPHNPVKDLVGISGECCCGSYAVEGELEAYAAAEPTFSIYLDGLRYRVMQRFPWDWGCKPPQSWLDKKRGQRSLFGAEDKPLFMPACVGCQRKTQLLIGDKR